MRTAYGSLFLLPILLPQPALASEPASARPATLYWESEHLARTKVRIAGSDAYLQEPLARLHRNADEALGRGPYSVLQFQADTSGRRICPIY